MEFRVLGPLEVVRDGRSIDLGGAKQRSVLAVLLVNARRVVSAEKLADAVWDGNPPAAAGTTLRSYLSNLRKALHAPDVIATRDRGYALDLAAGTIDAEGFEDLAGRGRIALIDGDAVLASKLLDEALALWRGEAFEDFAYTSFAAVEARRLEDIRLGTIEDLMEAKLAVGEHAQLTSQLEALTARYPLRERLWRSRMLALARGERTGEALEAYDQARRHLADELGIDPSPELRRVHESLVKGSDEFEPSRPQLAAAGAHIASFVFTDVERSTRMLRSLGEPERYAELIEQKRGVLRRIFEARGSRFIQAVGEELFAAFDSPTAGVHAAVDAQLALASQDWGDDTSPVLVRIGVHTGETTIVSGEYVGLSVHLASRICDAGHGGQILVSHACAELLDGEAIEPAQLADLGPHVLKDFDDPVRLHQVVHPDLRSAFPRLRTLSATPHNLPPRLTSFIARDEDTNEIASMLETARLVTLTGVGGVGKTRLALEVGAEVLPRYADGVSLCELAPVTDVDTIVQTVCKAVGVQRPPMTATPLRDVLLTALEHRRTLLILDNCEHVLEPVAELIAEIFARAPDAQVLATSREGIGVRGEQVRPTRSLAVPGRDDVLSHPEQPSAVMLFVDRARAVRPDFEIGPHNVDAVVDICRRLDGIPLGIELAAGQTTAMGPLEIAARLDKAFRFLRSGDRTAVERHRTLRAAIDWSYELLTSDEQLLLERLSVFAGRFSLDAVEHVCVRELEIDAGEVLAGLVSKHLVEADVSGAETRYGLLETVRQYARERLSARGDEESFRNAHATHYAALLHDVDPILDAALTAFLDRDSADIGAAFSWSVDSGNIGNAATFVSRFGFFAQRSVEVADWTMRVLEMPGIADHELGPDCFGAAAYTAWTQSEFDRVRELGGRALMLAPERGDPRRNLAISALAALLVFEGRLTEAEVLSDEIVAAADRAPGLAAVWTVNRALYAGYSGDRARALRLLDEAKPLAATYPLMRDQVNYIYAEVLDETVDPEAVIAAAERAQAHATSTGNTFMANASLLRAASVQGRWGDPVHALRRYAEVIDAWRFGGNHAQQWLTLQNLAELFARVGLDEAVLVVVAAVEADPRSNRAYGEQLARLNVVVAEVEEHVGPERAARARELGSGLDLRDVVVYAQEQIAEALERLDGV